MLDQIRGRSYEEALILLEYMPFRACEPVLDTLISVRFWRTSKCGVHVLCSLVTCISGCRLHLYLWHMAASGCLIQGLKSLCRLIDRFSGNILHQGSNSPSCHFAQAAANAKNNLGLRKARLYVSECMADAGPILKRIRPRAKGRCDTPPMAWTQPARMPPATTA